MVKKRDSGKKKPINFRSRQAYLNWLGAGHAKGVFAKTPGHQEVTIAGKPYKPKHSDLRPKKRKKATKKKAKRKQKSR